ncbi:protein BLISTER-like [Macadamia integrifolia]|uniref:protein BLISTER-like n=1 Tax=Macadamia integrifolia TaxID=60698 RepID=UPI001C4F0F06|nr:protein BLISTER-like [Macadamia integrifolia]
MASAQVLPNSGASSRRGNLEAAGKRRLEEFRKKRAEGRAKKPAPTGQQQSSDLGEHEKQPQESERVRLIDSDGAVTSERKSVSASELSGFITAGDTKGDLGSSSGTHGEPSVSANNYDTFSAHRVQEPGNDQGAKNSDGSGLPGSIHGYYDQYNEEKSELGAYPGNQGGLVYEFTMEPSVAPHPGHGIQDINKNSYQSSYYSMGEAQSKENETFSMDYRIKNSSITQPGLVSVPMESDLGFASKSGSGNVSTMYEDYFHSRTNSIESAPEVKQSINASVGLSSPSNLNMGESMLSRFNSHHKSVDDAPWRKSVSPSTGYGVDTGSLSNHVSLHSASTETGSRRPRPSFLDSLNVPRVSSESHFTNAELEKVEPFMSKSSKIHSVDALPSFNSQLQHMGPTAKSGTQNFLSGYEVPLVGNPVHITNEGEALRQNVMENSIEKKKPEFPLLKHDEDFAALEQHIEDLTQEKFSLQRALDGSRTLAESLAVENSSLTESYNQQGAVVNQLKSDMERLQEEIKAQLLELESVQMDCANARLECNAADERAKILASEVIGLEEKALRLRSNELKLEKQLENSNAEITSYKKKVSSLEKERQDLQSTIDALQEEKKILQSMLRKTSTIGKSDDVRKSPITTKDVSTSTEDMGDVIYASVIGENSGADTSTFHLEMQDTASFPSRGTSISPLVPENMQFHPSALSAAIPPDQLRMIDNINSLTSELAFEKEELMRALAVESSYSSKLKDINMELSRKLEVQTQRLELLTTQSMATENISARQSDPHSMTESRVFVDEGDEVVERVLGWVMKLFPGGPSKRRTSKLL